MRFVTSTFVLSIACSLVPSGVRAQTAAGPPPATAGSSALHGADFDALAERLHERVAREGGLTGAEAARRAVLTSTESRAREADIEAAESEIQRADVGYFPRVTMTGRYTRLSPIDPPTIGPGQGSLVVTPAPAGPLPAGAPLVAVPASVLRFPVILDQYLLQANVLVPISDYLLRIRQSHAAATESRDAAEATRDASRRHVASNAKLLYYAWARTRLSQAVTEQSVTQAKRHVELARAARDTGRMPQAEVLRAESLLASAELLNERTKNAALVADGRLKTALHDDRTAPYEIGEDLLAPMDTTVEANEDALLAEALRTRPEMRAFARSAAAITEQRKAASSSGMPRLDGFGNAYLGNPNPRIFPQQEQWKATWDLGVQLTWSPNDLGGSNATTRALDAKQKRLESERAALIDALRDEIHAAKVAREEARFALGTAERGLTAAEEAYRVRKDLFELGRGTNVELIDAETDILRARLEMIQARVDARVAKVRLEHAVGRDVGVPPEKRPRP